jgi:hypothetical protein
MGTVAISVGELDGEQPETYLSVCRQKIEVHVDDATWQRSFPAISNHSASADDARGIGDPREG